MDEIKSADRSGKIPSNSNENKNKSNDSDNDSHESNLNEMDFNAMVDIMSTQTKSVERTEIADDEETPFFFLLSKKVW